MNINNKKLSCHFFIFICLIFSSGCTTLDGPPNPDDPYENYNRRAFEFNELTDKYAIKPIAKGYDFIMPSFASKGVSNFFNNLDDIIVLLNQLLQLKIQDATATSARFVFNTVFGLAGLIDVAKHMDLPKQNEDFGQTLATWGVDSGPYIILPVFGPSTFRDATGLLIDGKYIDPIFKEQTSRESLTTLAIKFIDVRAGLIKASNIIDETAPDKYAFIRDAWLQRRNFLIYDGNPPDDFDEDELFSEEDLFKDENLFTK